MAVGTYAVPVDDPALAQDDPAFLTAMLEALPGGAFLLDALGTIRFATAAAAELVDREPAELIGESVLGFVDEDTAWTYATAVAMASDYPERVAGPMRITVVTAGGEHRTADLWAYNRLEDPVLGGIVCLLTPASTAMGLGEALQALANGAALEVVATKVARAMAGHPVVAEAAVVSIGASGARRLDDGDGWLPDETGPWFEVAERGVRIVCETVDELTPSLAAAARARGRSTVWVEPVGSGPPPARGALVVWRERPGRPSPNQLNALHQAAAILALVWDRHDSLV